ncbi:MAG: transglutaminase domain-containing protein [Planctomycetes bacterium]|nr:transglutaminase domain-containing protein [Planctomycetota bacterium]
MRDRLLPWLLALTLIDLAFVQATGIVGGQDLLPLWLLAAASPWLRRLQRWPLCRLAWNAGVLLVFTLLVRHATTTGLLHMLEDGLVLAVLCQVHLLNNIGERQRPDLVFFNSLLVCFVTSFFAPDLPWSLLFVLHALVLAVALGVNVLVRRGGVLDDAAVRRTIASSLRHAVAVLVATAALFVLLPRDFHRQGWLGDALAAPPAGAAGLADRIRLDDERPARLGVEVVARIAAADHRREVPSHWRAIVFSVFDGATWYPQDPSDLGSRFASDPAWEPQRDGHWRRPADGAMAAFQVELYDRRGDRLPVPLGAAVLRPLQSAGTLLDGKSTGGFTLVQSEDAPAGPLVYRVDVAARPAAVPIAASTRRHFVALPERSLPAAARALAQQLGEAADGPAVAAATADWLRRHRRYALPGEPGFARNLGEFLLGTGAGHCEYFATALALLLRLQDVPCRVVGGWLAHEQDPVHGGVVLRERDAHAWVEVLDADGRWSTLDATPPHDLLARRQLDGSWLGSAWQALAAAWSTVVGFDGRRRSEWLDGLAALPGVLLRALRQPPLALAAALAAAGWFVYRRRRRQREPAIAAFERAVRAAGLSLQGGETPRELLRRAELAAVGPRRLGALRQAADRHERLRYGPEAPDPGPRTSPP